MRSAKTFVPLCLLLVAALIFGFNNCSKVGFDTSPEVLKQQLLEFNSTSSILINGGAPYTNQQLVQLSLNSPRGVQMKISNQKDCSDGAWEPYATAKTWTLSKTNDLVDVFVQFQNLRGETTDCVSADITHDNIAPTAAYTSPAGVFTNNANYTVNWNTADNLSGVASTSCMTTGGTTAPCNSSLTVNSTSEGTNSLTVAVTDKAGNTSQNYVYSWFFDKTPPVVAINAQPASLTGSGNATLSFSANDTGSGIDKTFCQLDGGGFQACTSPLNYSGLTGGAHNFQVYATDKAGNSSVKAAANWTVDMTAPSIAFTQTPPANSNSATNTFGFTGTKNGATITKFECHLDTAAFASCTSPDTLTNVSQGSHYFEFRGIDSLGNVSAPLRYTWIVDLTPPVVQITAGPATLTNMSQASLQWTASDALSGLKTVECQLDGAAYVACAGGAINYPGLQTGAHTFNVRATDMAGNQAVATRKWTIDVTAPVVTITSGPNPYVKDLSSQFIFSATDSSGIASYECKIDNNAFSPCTSPYTSQNLNEGTHVFYVRATDTAGNVSSPANYTWALDLSPPIIRIVSAPVNLKSGDHAVIQYQVVDLASGVAAVKCGLNSTLANCQATATVDLGAITTAGNYTFQIVATDNVGNSMTENVNFTVTARPVICDPFVVGGDAACNGGLVGDIFYLDSAQQSIFTKLGTKTVDYFYSNGTKVNALLNLKQLFVSTRSFDTGFPTSNGQLITDNTGKVLYSYFAFRLNTVFKLDPLNDTSGWYQFATLSDDGSVVNITPQMSTTSNLISSDGDHSTRMGCSKQAIYIDDTTRLGMEIKYYQGPPTQIALVLMWKKVTGPTDPLDSSCGVATTYFGSSFNDFTNSGYGDLVKRGWKVIAPTNFIAPPTNGGSI